MRAFRPINQRVTAITLGVRDLERARGFYEQLGWRSGAAPADDVVFFQASAIFFDPDGTRGRSHTTPTGR